MQMNKGLTIIGLGSGAEEQMTVGVWKLLQQGIPIYVRTDKHPALQLLTQHGIAYQSFDSVYEQQASFTDVYTTIVMEIMEIARQRAIIYAVPGHPMVAESTVRLLQEACETQQVPLRIMGGESFIDQAFMRLGVDPIEGFQLLDATDLDGSLLQPKVHTFITQVYDRSVASEVKLTLMEWYPDDYPIVIAHSLGIAGEELVEHVPLYEIDRIPTYGNHSFLWIPRSEEEQVLNRRFDQLRDIVRILRSPQGCPWDREQTHASIRPHLIEETYEVLETIDDDDPEAMCEELGDLLMQILLHAQMEEEVGAFTIIDVIRGLNEKLIRRHPHVFGDLAADNPEEALQNWQAIKAQEKQAQGKDVATQSILAGVPRGLPAMMKAMEYQKRAAKVGFDFKQITDVLDKVREEVAELQEASQDASTQRIERMQEEWGDTLFALINVARFVDLDPEGALTRSNRKFANRFAYIEQKLQESGRSFAQSSLEEMDAWWNEAKKI